jgi:hypothetical protein
MAAGIALLVAGSIWLWSATPDPVGDGTAPSTHREWLAAVYERATPAAEPNVRLGELGPTPEFDSSMLGSEQATFAATRPTAGLDAFGFARALVAGQLGGMTAGAGLVSETKSEGDPAAPSVCVWLADDTGSARGCSPADGAIEYGVALMLTGDANDGHIAIVVLAPPRTSVVALRIGESRLWQRPFGAIALFSGDFPVGDGIMTTHATVTMYDSAGAILAEQTLPPSPTEDDGG